MYFVMLNMPSGRNPTPMINDDDAVAYYEDIEAARELANENALGRHFGYEIFELGTGES